MATRAGLGPMAPSPVGVSTGMARVPRPRALSSRSARGVASRARSIKLAMSGAGAGSSVIRFELGKGTVVPRMRRRTPRSAVDAALNSRRAYSSWNGTALGQRSTARDIVRRGCGESRMARIWSTWVAKLWFAPSCLLVASLGGRGGGGKVAKCVTGASAAACYCPTGQQSGRRTKAVLRTEGACDGNC
jgi:hypothetical protein